MIQKFAWVAGALLAAGACAKSTVHTAAGNLPTVTPPNASRLPVGTEIEVKTNQALGKDSRVGSEFSMRVDDPVKAQNGETAVPEGAMVYGHISGLNMNHDPAVIRLDFDKLVVNGKSHPFNAQVTQVKTPAMSNQTLKSAAIGGAAGAALGAIFSGGDLDKLVAGGVLGAAAGTVISLGKEHGDLPEGTKLHLRVSEPVQLR
jgi:hypothetical protein